MGTALKWLYEVFPPAELWRERQFQTWHDIATGTGTARKHDETIQKHAAAIAGEDPTVLNVFAGRLREEHQRLDAVENKARTILGVAGATVSFSTLAVAAAHDHGLPSLHKHVLLSFAVTGIIYLCVAVYAARRANMIGVRWYIDPEDVRDVRKATENSALAPLAIVAVTSLAFKDHMSDVTETKLRALHVAERCLRNGLAIVCAVLVARLCLLA